MKHNLTAEQIVYVMFISLITISMIYVWIENIKEKYYKKGYIHGFNRGKAVHGQGNTR
jgi:hypothetical protein